MTVVVGAAVVAVSSRGGAANSASTSPGDGDGIHVVSFTQVDPRLMTLTLSTTALPSPVALDILLPADYAANPDAHYPVLYLFDGTSGHASDWVNLGNAEKTTTGLPLIVVMPDVALNGDGGGWCTNWVSSSSGPIPQWETFHIDQLIPWVDSQFRTEADRSGRAIAGLSQGGFCSTSYAAQFPDMFSTVLSFSGAPDIYNDPIARVGAMAIINGTEFGLDQQAPDSMFGDPVTDAVNWAAHDPATLAENLAGMNIYLFNGNGFPGPYDSATDPNLEAMGIEGAIDYDTTAFHTRLDELGISSSWDDYGNGTHSWPYWARDLSQSIGSVMADFASPPPPPAEVTYTSASASYAQFGWQVTMNRAAEEFSTLENADAQGFALAGSGSATVTTPPLFTPGAVYQVTESGPNASGVNDVVADGTGALTISVDLGPSNQYAEYSPEALVLGTQVFTTTVVIHLAA